MKHTLNYLIASARLGCLGGLLSLCSTLSVHAADPSSDGAGEIAIYSEATGTDVLTTADLTHDFDTTDREDAGSFTRSGSDITLNRDGHYLVIYDARFNGAPVAGTEERVEIQSCLNLAGTKLPTGWSQGFIRRQQSHVDAITTGMAIINATANDVLQLQSFRTDATGVGTVTRFPNETAIQLVKLDEVNMSYARLSLGADLAGPTLNGTAVKVAYDTEDELGVGYSYASGDLTLADAGKYLVIANSYVDIPNNRIGFVQELTLDGAPISGTRTNIYLRGSQSTQEGAASIGTIIETTGPNQVLSVLGELDGAAGTATYKADRCALTVVKIPSAAAGTIALDPDFIRLSSNANQNINTTADLVFNDQVELDADYTHAANSSAITVATGGDYLFLGSFYGADDGAARGLSNPGWAINNTRLSRGQSGRYTRNLGPPEFGNTLGLVASNLNSSDQIKMVTRAIGTGGTNNANPVTLQGVRIASLFTPPADFEVLVAPLALTTAEGGATATYDLSLGLTPILGNVTVTVTPDAQSEVSLNGTDFFSTLEVVFSDTTAQTITVRATDDADVESGHSSAITHAITATDDVDNYPLSQPVSTVNNTIADNDVVPVTGVADASTTNANEDVIATEAVIGASLLANDTDGIGNTVSAFDSVSALGAAVNVNPDGTFTYDPTTAPGAQVLGAGETGMDTFSYTVQDADGNTDVATVSITVDGANDAPEALPNVLNDGPLENGSSFINTVDLTANDGSYRNDPNPLTFPAGSDLRLLPGITTSQSPSLGVPPGNGFAERALDGNVGTFTHTDSNDNTVDHIWEADFGQDVTLENVTLFNRTDCCGERLRDITVKVLDSEGVEVFSSALLNPDNAEGFLGNAGGSLFVDMDPPVVGRVLRVIRTPDLTDIVSDGSILSLGEVTVIGSAPGSYPTDELLLNYDAAQSAGNGRWENLGSNAGSAMDWLLTSVDLVPVGASARSGISAAYQWDAATDRTILTAPGGDSVHDLMPGDPDTGDATWEFWVKPDNTSSVMTLFETGGGTGFGAIINNGLLEAATELDGNENTRNGSYVSYDLIADPLGLVGGDPTTEFNQYAVTITINGGLELYVNGVEVDSTTSGVSGDWDGGDGSGLGRFGASNHGGFVNTAATAQAALYNAPFLGQMAIVRLYEGVLSPALILQNFNAVNTGTDIDGDTIATTGVLDGSGAFVAIGSPATLASGAIVTMTDATGGFDYNPNGVFSLLPGQIATDTFSYVVTDGNGLEGQSTVTVDITGVASAIDDLVFAKEEQVRIFTPNELVKNDEILATEGAYIDLNPSTFSGAIWTNQGNAGAFRNAAVTGTEVVAPELMSGFQVIGSAATAATLGTLDAISTGDTTLEIWFRPEAGQLASTTLFETGGNGNGFSLVYNPNTNEVTATVDGGDDATANIQATVSGISTTEFNQLFVVIQPNGGDEVGVDTGIFEDLLTLYLNNDPTEDFDATVDAVGVNEAGLANDWAGTDNGGFNVVAGTTALNENFPGMAGEVAIFRAYTRVLDATEMEANFDASIQPITAVSSPTTVVGSAVILNGDGTITIDYSAISLATGDSILDEFTYTTDGGTATVNVMVEGNTVQEDWRSLYYGDIANSGPGADSAMGVNGLTNLQSFALDLDPTSAADTLDVDQDAGTITEVGPPAVWVDPADGRIYLRYTRRTDLAALGLTVGDQFSRDLLVFEDSADLPTVIANGTGASGAAIEAVQSEFPLVLPVGGGKARFGRVIVTAP